jgi:hypothetical protein
MILDLDDLENSFFKLKQESLMLGLVINPILEKYDLVKKEKLELCQIGKFLLNVDSHIEIIEKPQPPNPDFILKLDNLKIGLEHTRIINGANSQRYFSIVNLLDNAELLHREKYPNTNVSASFRFMNDELIYKKNEKVDLAIQICEFVFQATQGIFINKPVFIEDIKIQPHSTVSFDYIENDFSSDKLTKEELLRSIKIKEIKLEKYYSKNNEINEFWLVLMIGSLSSVSFEIDDKVDYRSNSIFDKVFLVMDFDEEIIQIK